MSTIERKESFINKRNFVSREATIAPTRVRRSPAKGESAPAMINFLRMMLRWLGLKPESKTDIPLAKAHGQDIDFKLLADNSRDIIMHCRPNGEPIYISLSSQRLLGWTPEDMIGKPPDTYVHPEDMPAVTAAMARSRSKDEEEIRISCRIKKSDESWVWVECVAHTIRHPITGELGDTVVIMRDITERKALEDHLNTLASTDGLTGLANRRAFDEALEHEWRRTLREATQLSLLLIDVDHFKAFNDRYGHQVGDDCLRAVAAALKGTVRRPGDVIARYGGEEIAVILPNTSAAGAVVLAHELCEAVKALEMPHAGNLECKGVITVSIGAATALSRIGGTMSMPAGLLLAADTALYKAKNNGRNRVETSFVLAPDESKSGQNAA